MRVLLDINVILDILLDRTPHVAASAAVWSAIEAGRAEGVLAAHAVTTLHYLLRKEHGAVKTRQILTSLLRVFGVAAVDQDVIREGLEMSLPDFEDSVTAAAARHAGCALVVTRDPRGFRGSPVRALAPDMAAPILSGRGT